MFAQKQNAQAQLDFTRIPKHVAIIMDGNGRWAKKKFMPRIAGHNAGMKNVKKITQAASRLGVKVLTLYAFSTENWKRPEDEVNYLMQLPTDFFGTFMPDLMKENVKVQVMGEIAKLPAATQETVQKAIDQTAQNTGLILNFALNYGARDEMIAAIKQISKQVVDQQLDIQAIDESVIDQALMTAAISPYSDPELLIRTSSEQRISNFLLWQLAYSELVFVEQFWPDFTAEHLKEAILTYQKRDRRFGGLK